MSTVSIPGLDIQERSPGSFRVRVRVYPFFGLTLTASSELEAVHWGCRELERLHALHCSLLAQGRLPASQVTREEARQLGLEEQISGASPSAAQTTPAPSSPGSAIFMADVLSTYMEHEGKSLSACYASRAKRLVAYFGSMALPSVTSGVIQSYVDARLAGLLGFGRAGQAAYATKNREYQRNKRRRTLGIPVIPRPAAQALPSTGSVRHELKLMRQALKAFATRSDEMRERISTYALVHPILTFPLPSPGEPRKRRISDDELTRILRNIQCPLKRAAILLGIYTSLRRAEIVSLRWEDIDFNGPTVRLRAPMVVDPKNPSQVRKKRKTKTVERDVPLVPEAAALLEKLGPVNGHLFTFAATSLTQAFGRAAETAGVKDVRVHDCRREALSWLHDVHGLTLEQLTLFSGHTEVKTLQKHYFQPSAAKLASKLASGGPTRSFMI